MSITAFVCSISIGVGSVTLSPAIIQTPRYDGAKVQLILEDGKLRDIVVDGAYDRDYSYAAHGLELTGRRISTGWLLQAAGSGDDAVQESIIVGDDGKLLWTQIASAGELKASSASLFTGTCVVE